MNVVPYGLYIFLEELCNGKALVANFGIKQAMKFTMAKKMLELGDVMQHSLDAYDPIFVYDISQKFTTGCPY